MVLISGKVIQSSLISKNLFRRVLPSTLFIVCLTFVGILSDVTVNFILADSPFETLTRSGSKSYLGGAINELTTIIGSQLAIVNAFKLL